MNLKLKENKKGKMYVKGVYSAWAHSWTCGMCIAQDVRMEWGPLLPDSLVLEIFLRLPYDAVLRAGLTCRQWLAVSRDEFLWRELFYSYYRIPRAVPRHPGVYSFSYISQKKSRHVPALNNSWSTFCAAAVSWHREFKRLFDCIPCVEVQTLREHSDQVLHLAFSHKGHRFSSCSKDCTVKVRIKGLLRLLSTWILFSPSMSSECVHLVTCPTFGPLFCLVYWQPCSKVHTWEQKYKVSTNR